MKRLFYLVPDLKMTQAIVNQLKENGFKESQVHVLGQKNYEIEKAHLHEANLIQKTDLLPSLKRGAFFGFLVSIILCVLIAFTGIIKMKFVIIIAILVFGVIFGAWASSLIGISVTDPIVEKYENYLKEGHYILMIDPLSDNESNNINVIINHFPGVKLAGVE